MKGLGKFVKGQLPRQLPHKPMPVLLIEIVSIRFEHGWSTFQSSFVSHNLYSYSSCGNE